VHPGSKTALALAGKDISELIKPASASPHEPAIYNENKVTNMSALQKSELSLERDKIRQSNKYMGAAIPSMTSARFAVALPTSPQHSKYCWRSGNCNPPALALNENGGSDSPSAKASRSSVDVDRSSPRRSAKGNSQHFASDRKDAMAQFISAHRLKPETMSKMFDELDVAKSGLVARRALALQLMRTIVGASGETEMESAIFQHIRLQIQEYAKTSTNLTKDEFIGFGQHSGMVLEYATKLENEALVGEVFNNRLVASRTKRDLGSLIGNYEDLEF